MIRLGIIGCGGISRYAHAPAIMRLGKTVECVVVSDINIAAAEVIASEMEVSDYTNNYREVLKRDDVDAVVIALPHSLHVEVTCAAAEAGKHILLEKPMGRSMAEAEIIAQSIKENNVLFMIGLNRRFLPQYRKVKETIEMGMIGTPKLVTLDSQQYREFSGWKGSREHAGGGLILDPGIHCIDQLLWWMGDVKEVFVRTLKPYTDELVETEAIISLRFRSGALGQLLFTGRARGYKGTGWNEAVAIYGEKGDISTSIPNPEVRLHSSEMIEEEKGHLILWETQYTPLDEYGRPWNSFESQMAEFVRFVREKNSQPIPGIKEALAALQVIHAAYESCSTGNNIEITSLSPI